MQRAIEAGRRWRWVRRDDPVVRDPRALAVARTFGLLSFAVVTSHRILERGDLLALAAALGLGMLLQAVSIWGRSDPLRRLAYEAGLTEDVVTLALLLHVTGGTHSPLLPLITVWAVIGVMSHGEVGAVVYVALLLVSLVVQVPLEDSALAPRADSLLLAVTVLVTATSAASSWWMARSLAGARTTLEAMALRDPLTGLWNRRSFEQRRAQLAALAGREILTYAAAAIDLDRFKHVNDRHGHEAGDMVLVRAATLLAENVRRGDEVFRLGGDELAVLFPATSAPEARVVLARIAGLLAAEDIGFGAVTLSAGIADSDESEDPPRLADLRLYLAKDAGRNRIVAGADPAAIAQQVRTPVTG